MVDVVFDACVSFVPCDEFVDFGELFLTDDLPPSARRLSARGFTP